MATVAQWTGREARALRLALRLSVRAFAAHLGIAPRTVAKWEALGAATQPRPDTQAILDTALAGAGTAAQARFGLLRQPDGGADRLRGRLAPGEHEAWEDDLDRALVSVSRQDFRAAGRVLRRWLDRAAGADLDDRGLYLRGRSVMLLGDLRRDQGLLAGPGGAAPAYQLARRIFTGLDVPVRVAQAELSLAVMTEMSGRPEAAASAYRRLAADERLGGRDRARAGLWTGTALSKARQHEAAIAAMAPAIRAFDMLGEQEDWSVGHQKLALACRGAGRLDQALRHIATAREAGPAATPMQRVRLGTACGHIMLTDPATSGSGLGLLDRASGLAREFGLAHQAASISAIRREHTAAPR